MTVVLMMHDKNSKKRLKSRSRMNADLVWTVLALLNSLSVKQMKAVSADRPSPRPTLYQPIRMRNQVWKYKWVHFVLIHSEIIDREPQVINTEPILLSSDRQTARPCEKYWRRKTHRSWDLVLCCLLSDLTNQPSSLNTIRCRRLHKDWHHLHLHHRRHHHQSSWSLPW